MERFNDWQRQYDNRAIILQSNKFDALEMGDQVVISCYRDGRSEAREILLNQKLNDKAEVAKLRSLVAQIQKEFDLSTRRAFRTLVQMFVLAMDLWEYEQYESSFTDDFTYAHDAEKSGAKAGRGLFEISDLLKFWSLLKIQVRDLPIDHGASVSIPPSQIEPSAANVLIEMANAFKRPAEPINKEAPVEEVQLDDSVRLQGGKVLLSKKFDRVLIEGEIIPLPPKAAKVIELLYFASQKPTFKGVPVKEMNDRLWSDEHVDVGSKKWQAAFKSERLQKVRRVLIDNTTEDKTLLLKI